MIANSTQTVGGGFISKPKINIEKLARTELPPLPASVSKVLQLLKDVNVSARELSDAVRYDPLLTTRILQLANSALYSTRQYITSLQQAIEVVGTKALQNILIIDTAASVFSKEISNTEVGNKLWRHSLAVALLSKAIGSKIKDVDVEEAFICGLLHDIGKILLLRADSANYLNVLHIQDESEMMKQESEIFGYSHSQVGGLVARRWYLPASVCYAILGHHDPCQSSESVIMSHIINLADIIANSKEFGLRAETDFALMCSESSVILQISEEESLAFWESIQENLQEVISLFSPQSA